MGILVRRLPMVVAVTVAAEERKRAFCSRLAKLARQVGDGSVLRDADMESADIALNVLRDALRLEDS